MLGKRTHLKTDANNNFSLQAERRGDRKLAESHEVDSE